MTAVGGFVFDPSGNGRPDVTVRLFSAPPSGDRCGTYAYGTNNYVASYTTGSDGFYFIWQKNVDNTPSSTGPTRCRAGTSTTSPCATSRTARQRHGDAVRPALLAGTLDVEHASATRNSTRRTSTSAARRACVLRAQPISGKMNKTLGTIKVALLDGFGNVMTMDSGGGASTITLSNLVGDPGGTAPSATDLTKPLSERCRDLDRPEVLAPAGVYHLDANSSVGRARTRRVCRSTSRTESFLPPQARPALWPGPVLHVTGRVGGFS